MAIGGISQSTIPTYFDESSTKLNGLVNNQILMCGNYLGGRRNFIVVDEDSINSKIHNVETCYDNGWIIDFPNASAGYKETYKIVLTGADYDVGQAGIQTGKLFIKDKSKYTVSINGTPILDTDWHFLVPSAGNYHAGVADYSSSIMLNSAVAASLVGTDLIEVEYTENIVLGGDYHLKLYRSDGQPPRPFMITKSGIFGDRAAFAESATIIDMWTVNVTYRKMDHSGSSLAVKRQSDLFRIAEFATDVDLAPFGLKIEVYKMQESFNSDGINSWSTRSSGGNTKLVYETTINKLNVRQFKGTGPSGDKINGIYMVRVVDTANGGVSPFLQTKVSIRSFPIIETDASLSKNNCVGYYSTSRLV